MKKNVVLDSFAIVCFFQREQGFEQVQELLYHQRGKPGKVLLNIINWGETYYIIRRRFGANKAAAVLELLEQLPIDIIPAEARLVRQAAEVKADFLVSYADAFAVATAITNNAAVMTSDPEFQAIEHLVEVRWLS